MSKYFETNFDPFMSAYRKMYSCETALVRWVEDWKHAVDHGKSVGVLSTDMSKAFDTMHPTLLLAKLKAYGFSEGALSLMRSFFEERKGRTKLGTAVSEWKEIKMVFPQGSDLGLLLWDIYQNDLFYLSRASSLSMYADDHQLYYAHSNVKDLMDTIRSEGGQMSSWFQENHLVGDTSKYQAMVIGKKHEPSLTSVDINGHSINTTE